MAGEHWKKRPAAKDYAGAQSYLSLLVGVAAAKKLVQDLHQQDRLVAFAAKDLLRASNLELLDPDDSEVAADLEKVSNGTKLTPVLLVEGTPLWIADGYHRVCASYHLDEKAAVHCRIVPRPR